MRRVSTRCAHQFRIKPSHIVCIQKTYSIPNISKDLTNMFSFFNILTSSDIPFLLIGCLLHFISLVTSSATGAEPSLRRLNAFLLCVHEGQGRLAQVWPASGSSELWGVSVDTIDWFRGKNTGTSHISWENHWFPVDFPFI